MMLGMRKMGIMTRNTTTEAFFLDTYSAIGAYSWNQLSGSATNCIRLREDGGSTESNFGFSSRFLDTTAVTAFLSGAGGHGVTWFDQKNSNDLAQASAVPQPGYTTTGYQFTSGNGDFLSKSGLTFDLAIGQAWTIACWADFGATPVSTESLIRSTGAGNDLLQMQITSGRKLNSLIRDSVNPIKNVTSTTSLPADTVMAYLIIEHTAASADIVVNFNGSSETMSNAVPAGANDITFLAIPHSGSIFHTMKYKTFVFGNSLMDAAEKALFIGLES